MIEHIKGMFSKMNDATRTQALDLLRSEFQLKSAKEARNSWIIGGRIPLENQQKISELFKQLLEIQDVQVKEILVHF